MASVSTASRQEIQAEVDRLRWAHSIDLGNGIVTPGIWGAHNVQLHRAIGDIDFRGKKVLDIGCWDGLFSFEAEKRGAAEVYATDLISQRDLRDQQTFQLAHRVLESKVKYFPHTSVFDVETLGVRDFDVVIYAGVYYHLKDPLRSITALRRVMRDGGLMIVEGEVIDSRECIASFHYRKPYGLDHSNWWMPSPSCLREWVECSFFEIAKDYSEGGPASNPKSPTRYTLTARAVSRLDSLYAVVDPDLEAYDLRQY